MILNTKFHFRILMIFAVIHLVKKVNFSEPDSALWASSFNTCFIEEYFINQTKISGLELQLRIRHLFFPFLQTDSLNKGYYVYT